MKISEILYSVIIGLSVGASPIFGYNYGAKKYERVKETLKIVLGTSFIITIISLLLFQIIPDKLILIFGSGNNKYMEFACLTFRIYLMLVICNGIQIASGIFFQAIGKSVKSAMLSLSRQILLLIPAMFILGHYFGIMGLLYSGPVGDAVAFILAVVFIVLEYKNLNKSIIKEPEENETETKSSKLQKHIVITIGREYGSGGRYIGELVAEKLGIKCYDKEFISHVSKSTGLSKEYIEKNEQKRNTLEALNNLYYGGLNTTDELFISESQIIKDLAKKESCIIIGRCADFVLKDEKNIVKIFIYSDLENKIKRATKHYGLSRQNAEKEIKRINKLRSNHYKHYTGRIWNNPENYDICINSDKLGIEESANLITEIINKRSEL